MAPDVWLAETLQSRPCLSLQKLAAISLGQRPTRPRTDNGAPDLYPAPSGSVRPRVMLFAYLTCWARGEKDAGWHQSISSARPSEKDVVLWPLHIRSCPRPKCQLFDRLHRI